jgi:nucleoid-associated protein YgaU
VGPDQASRSQLRIGRNFDTGCANTVKPGDDLSKISTQLYGDTNMYMKSFDANKDKLTDADKIEAGMNLLIP